jgi:hypothetical protein
MSRWKDNFVIDALSFCFSNKRRDQALKREFSWFRILIIFFIYGLSRQLLEIAFGQYGYFWNMASFVNTMTYSYVLLFTSTVIIYWEASLFKEALNFKAMVKIVTYLLITFPLVAVFSYFFNYGGPFGLLPRIPYYFYIPIFDNPLMYPNIYMPIGLAIVIIILFIRVPGLISSIFKVSLKKTIVLVLIFFLFLFWYAFMISYRVGTILNNGLLNADFTYYYNLFFFGIIFLLFPFFVHYYGGIKTWRDKISVSIFLGGLIWIFIWDLINLPCFTSI